VQLQVLSPAASPPYAEKEAEAVAAARLINDSYAELGRKYPGRFNAVVSLPLPHIDASCARWSEAWISSACSGCR
jgi:aminocarboxymuconate-semialdehyde decarboxylase